MGAGNSVGEGVDVGIGCGELVGVGVGDVDESIDSGEGVGVESPALAGLTLNCRIGQKIRIVISSNIDEDVSTTPRDNLLCEYCDSARSSCDRQS